MPVQPKLLNPLKIKISQKDDGKQQYDPLRRTTINVVAKQPEFILNAQVKWNTQLGDFANPENQQIGIDEREMGYFVALTKDLKAMNKTLKRGDRINDIGGLAVKFYILRVEYGSHYGGEFKIIKVVFSDREGQDG